MHQIIDHALIYLMPLRVSLLNQLPLLLLLIKSLQRMIAELQIHVQVTVYRHGKNGIPNSVQLLLCESRSAVRFFREQRSRRRNKLLYAAVDLVEYFFIHVRDIHAALSDGIVRIAEVNAPIIKKCSELVVGMGERNTNALYLLRHNASLYPMKF